MTTEQSMCVGTALLLPCTPTQEMGLRPTRALQSVLRRAMIKAQQIYVHGLSTVHTTQAKQRSGDFDLFVFQRNGRGTARVPCLMAQLESPLDEASKEGTSAGDALRRWKEAQKNESLFKKLFGAGAKTKPKSKPKSKPERRPVIALQKDDPSTRVVRDLFECPSHVLPPLESLFDAFITRLLPDAPSDPKQAEPTEAKRAENENERPTEESKEGGGDSDEEMAEGTAEDDSRAELWSDSFVEALVESCRRFDLE